jgi:glutamyl-tRNA synthetase
VPESLEYNEESLKWLGIKYDGEKKFQSDRLDLYQKAAENLVAEGKAYKCFCTPERLEAMRKEQEAKKEAPHYDRCCLRLTSEEIAAKEEAGEKSVIRFKMPDSGKAVWEDLVRGKIEIDYSTQDDPIILKSDGWPTYHLANIVDDHEMNITNVIRGEEWIPSTPKHLALYDAFDWKAPSFAHLPVILGSDKSKLSKRHGDTAILDYCEKGYLPEAMVNFLALLGWNPGTTEEIFTMQELEKQFDIKRVQKAPAVFDIEKLNWLNGIYIRKMDNKELATRINEIMPDLKITKLNNFDRILEVEKSRLTTLRDIENGAEFFLEAQNMIQAY